MNVRRFLAEIMLESCSVCSKSRRGNKVGRRKDLCAGRKLLKTPVRKIRTVSVGDITGRRPSLGRKSANEVGLEIRAVASGGVITVAPNCSANYVSTYILLTLRHE